MIGTIASREFGQFARDGRLFWSALIFLGLFAVALFAGWQRSQSLAAERAEAQEIVYTQWLDQGEKNPHSAAHYGIYAFWPLSPLAYFDSAVTNFTGVSIWLEAHKQNFASARPASDMTSVQRFGDLTGAFVLQLLLPLVIIFFAFGAFASEREAGTLKMALSTGVSPTSLFLGKSLGILIALAVIVVPAALLAAIVLIMTGAAEHVPRLMILFGAYGLYGLIFLFLGLAVSASARTAQGALVILVAFWALASFVVPRIGASFADAALPTPTSIAFADAIAADLDNGVDGVSQAQRINELKEKTLARFNVQQTEDLPINFEGLTFILMEEMGDAVFDKHYGGLQQTFSTQQTVLDGLGFLSPLLAIKHLSAGLSGTSLADHHDFASSAESFRRDFVKIMNEDLAFNSRSGETTYRAGPELWAKVSSFSYAPRSLGQVLAAGGLNLLALLLWAAGSFFAALLIIRRLKGVVS